MGSYNIIYINQASIRGLRSKRDSHGHLKRARAARSEDLGGPAGGLAERCAGQIAAIAGEVRIVVQVEHLANERQAPALAKHERPAQAQIQRVEIVVQRVAIRQTSDVEWLGREDRWFRRRFD